MSVAIVSIVFLILFAIILVAISMGFRFLEIQRKKQVAGMLEAVDGAVPGETTTSIMVDRSRVDPLEQLLNRPVFMRRITRMIQQAGLSWTPTGLALATLIAGAAGAAIGWILHPLGFTILSILAATFLLGSMPFFYLLRMRTKRLGEFEQQFPEALDFLARSMRAGHAFSVSLEMLGNETPAPLGQEFRTLFNEQNLGAPMETALNNLAERVPLLDLKLFVSSVMLQKQTGGNLSEVLLRLAYVIRERFRLRGQVKALSAHGRLTALVLTILPVVLMLALMFVAPGYLSGLANDPDGKWMILGAVVGQILAYFIMRRITNIKV